MPNQSQQYSMCSLLEKLLNHLRNLLLLDYQHSHPHVSKEELREFISNQYLDISRANLSIFDQYDAVLKWCSTKSENDPFKSVKENFMALHYTTLKKSLHKINSDQYDFVKNLRSFLKQRKEECSYGLTIINKQIALQKACLVKLKEAANLIAKENVTQHQDYGTFQNTVYRLKKLVVTLKKMSLFVPEAKTIPLKNLPDTIYIKHKNREAALSELNQNIQQYQHQLKEEGWFKKFLSFFSPTRRRRLRAIDTYEKLTDIKDINKRYEAIGTWVIHHDGHSEFKSGKTKSRFYHCIHPFIEVHDRLSFEEIPALQEPLQMEINDITNGIRNVTETHNVQINSLNKTLQNLMDETANLNQGINAFVTEIDHLKQEGFGYLQNQADAIREKINTLAPYLIIENKKDPVIQKAEALVKDIREITRHTPNEAIQQLKSRFEPLKKNKNAAEFIEHAVENIIRDTISHGGKGNNFNFVGTAKAEKIVAALGTSKQQKRFKTVKSDSVQRANESHLRAEQTLVNNLKRELEIGKLHDTLTSWRDAYLKHNGLENKIRDSHSDSIYCNEIKVAKHAALQFHKKNLGTLGQFVEKAIAAVHNASNFHAAIAKEGPLESLGWRRIDIFVLVYGNQKQIDQWKRILPQIKENLGLTGELQANQKPSISVIPPRLK